MSSLSQFFGSGNAQLPLPVNPNAIPLKLLIVGGGGAGGAAPVGGGGGGAGKVLYVENVLVNRNIAYPIRVGEGGRGQFTGDLNGKTSYFSNLKAEGGGGGGYRSFTPNPATTLGSGGGISGFGNPGTESLFDSFNTYTCISADSNVTVASFTNKTSGTVGSGTGGGGAGSVGTNINGGAGINISIFPGFFGGGGGGGQDPAIGLPPTFPLYSGGSGVGGTGGSQFVAPTPGVDGTGSGGGGSVGNDGIVESNGGSGVVIVAYLDTFPAATAPGATQSFETDIDGSYRIYTFTDTTSIASITFN